MSTPPYSELNILRAMIDYISPSAQTRHADRVRSEFSDRIAAAPRHKLILQTLLSKPAHIPLSDLEAYLQAVGEDLMGELRDMDDDLVSPFSFVDFSEVPMTEQVRLFDLCARWHPEDRKLSRINDMIKAAILSGNADFLGRIQSYVKPSEQEFALRIEQSAGLEEAGPEAAHLIESLLESADLSSAEWSCAIAEIIRKKRIRSFALLLAAGWSPDPAFLEMVKPREKGSAIERFAFRLSASNHAALKILRDIPNTRTILGMDAKAISRLLGGPNVDSLKRREKFQKLEKSVRHFNAKGEAVPDRLERSYLDLKKSIQEEDESFAQQVR
jgi:hypothetical protein